MLSSASEQPLQLASFSPVIFLSLSNGWAGFLHAYLKSLVESRNNLMVRNRVAKGHKISVNIPIHGKIRWGILEAFQVSMAVNGYI